MTELERQLQQIEFKFKGAEKKEDGYYSDGDKPAVEDVDNQESMINLLFGLRKAQDRSELSPDVTDDNLNNNKTNMEYNQLGQDSGRLSEQKHQDHQRFLDSALNPSMLGNTQ